MTTSVIINGAKGKMGSYTVDAITAAEDLECIASLDYDDDLAAAIKQHKPDIVVDFTNANVAYKNAKLIIDNNIRPVIGTTGFALKEIEVLQKLCTEKNLGGLIAPNFSIGAVLMMQYAKDAAKYFDQVEIIETHHQHKIDAPSGTAKKTAQLIDAVRSKKPMIPSPDAKARGDHDDGVPIHSLRLPGRVAHQQVIFGCEGETLTIQNDCIDRQAYMPGVLLACRKVMGLDHLAYGLEEIL